MENINLKRATLSDVDIFLSLEKSVAHLKTYSAIIEKDEVKKEIENNIVYLIKAGDSIVGSIEYKMEDDDTAYFSGLVVSPDFQGKGIAREAIKQVLEIIGEDKKIHLVTHPDNIPAVKLYLSFGFIIGERKDNYFGDGEPRIVMTRLKQNK
ncbi:MAG: GNAT family N-acetyltransferase [Patescibacteria group bacterium]|nr:GNAT family N-acetyltransferase [Patescibacteria group bacterium]